MPSATDHHQNLAGEMYFRQPLTSPPPSAQRFPDGGAWRIEIPSVEGIAALEEAIESAQALDVPLHRISQGSGVSMLSDDEISAMVELSASVGVDLCLFARPGADWDADGSSRARGTLANRARGLRQLNAVLDEVKRGCDLGARSFLISDEGALLAADQLRRSGRLPADVQFKVSIHAAPANPASFRLQGMLGADSINVPVDLSTYELAEYRASGSATIDFYIEAPDDLGGFVRIWEVAEIAEAAAPAYLKFGLSRAPGIYPAGGHIADVVQATAKERVRRARLGLDALARSGKELPMSPLGSREQPARDAEFVMQEGKSET